jgi:hypothetical protein
MLALRSVESISLAIDTKCLLNELAMVLSSWVDLPSTQTEVIFWLDGFLLVELLMTFHMVLFLLLEQEIRLL